MNMWSERVDEPFRSNQSFWRSLTASLAAVATLLAASLLSALVGGAASVAYVVPVVLLVVAATLARSSSAVTRPQFATREQWRDAERDAVARALLLRRRGDETP